MAAAAPFPPVFMGSHVDGGALLALHHRLVELSIEFRMIDYGERVWPRND